MKKTQAPEWGQLPPIRALPNTVYAHGDDEYYHVGGAVAEILEAPSRFKFGWIDSTKLIPQLQGQGNIDHAYVSTLSDEDSARPVLMITYPDGSARMIDGYHRTTRAIQRGVKLIGAWVLTPEQTARFRMNTAMVKAIGLTSQHP